jgi:hypothetical protein
MKRAVFFLSTVVFGIACVSALQISGKDLPSPTTARHDGTASGAIGRALTRIAPPFVETEKTDERDVAAIRQRVKDGEAGTYIGDILRERDSALVRWPDRTGTPLTVWIQPISNVADFTREYISRVQVAFESWDGLQLPVRFAFVADSASADVHVNWIDHFNEPISGRTRWARNDDWVITDANIILAVHHHQGETLDPESMKAMAMHEIGHLLGLDHTVDSMSIMAPRVRVRDLTDADRATVKLLYALPAGPIR